MASKSVLVVGGDVAALAKVKLLIKTPCDVTVIATCIHPEMVRLDAERKIRWENKDFSADDVKGQDLVIAASERYDLNRTVAIAAKENKVLLNVVDTPEYCDVITPAIIDRSPVTIAIGTEGHAPVLARVLKSFIENSVDKNMGQVAIKIAQMKNKVNSLSKELSRQYWRVLYAKLNDGFGKHDFMALLSQSEQTPLETTQSAKVVFIGAGPGDAELITLKGLKYLKQADVVIYDRLVGEDLLEYARREATFHCVGKNPDGVSVSQSRINSLLVDEATQGKLVVRLKGGDPSLFGRLDEELDALSNQAVETLVIPGITASLAAAAATKCSLTRRGRNTAFSVITGQDIKGFAEHHWKGLVSPGHVFAIYMGRKSARFTQGRLLLHGMSKNTPVVLVENISHLNQRILTGNMGELDTLMTENNMTHPVIILVGMDKLEHDLQTHGVDWNDPKTFLNDVIPENKVLKYT